MRNIILTGFMATGKSSVGRRLSKELGLKFLDVDELIEKEAGLPVKDIFAASGEASFREMEASIIKKISSGGFGDGLVVATGGGAVVNSGNRQALKGCGTIICLTATVEEMLKRVGGREDRPLLASGDRREKMEGLLDARKEAYADCDFIIDTTGMDIPSVVNKIKCLLDKRLHVKGPGCAP